MKTKKYKYTIIRPGGNDTCLIEAIIEKPARKKLNDYVLQKFPTVEQVGFYSFDRKKNAAVLEMAGGEFCGNALRSLAYLVLENRQGEILCNVSGATYPLKAGVKEKNYSYAQMPIVSDFNSVKKLRKNLWQVDLEGITHLITFNSEKLDIPTAKSYALKCIEEAGLLCTKPATGVMFVNKNAIQPVVRVPDIQTLFYETACASGTAAVGLWSLSMQNKNFIVQKIRQPSGCLLKVKAEKTTEKFKEVHIEGPVELLEQGLFKF